MSESFTAEEVVRLRRLLEEDAIRKTKMLYSHYMDTGQIDALADLFTEDAVCEFGPYGQWQGRETIRSNYWSVFKDGGSQTFFAMHNTSDHFVRVTSDTTAEGRSYLIDVVTGRAADEMPIVWFGVYDETYRRVNDDWLIEYCRLQFLWPERNTGDDFPGNFSYKD